MADAIWELKYKGEPVSITLDDLTRHRMRELRSQLGDDYGIPSQFMSRLLVGDYEAVAGALWIHDKVSGKNEIPNMLELDFCESDFEALPEKPKRGPKAKAVQAATPDKTTSPETPSS